MRISRLLNELDTELEGYPRLVDLTTYEIFFLTLPYLDDDGLLVVEYLPEPTITAKEFRARLNELEEHVSKRTLESTFDSLEFVITKKNEVVFIAD